MKAVVFSICAVLGLIGLILILDRTVNFKREEERNQQMANLRDLARNSPPDVYAIRRLISATKSNDLVERNAAIGYLGQVGSNAVPAVGILIEALNGPDPFDAREAATSLGEIGSGARHAIPDLMKAVQEHPSEDIGWFAAESLGQICTSNDTEVVAVLTQAAKSTNERMRNSANEGLQKLGYDGDQ
jgi:HEAT repeat protein